jgi:hypothetical protein
MTIAGLFHESDVKLYREKQAGLVRDDEEERSQSADRSRERGDVIGSILPAHSFRRRRFE